MRLSKTLLLTAAAFLVGTGLCRTGAAQPNIIFYMVDDLGWNHISARQPTMGTGVSFYKTPNIEKLAAMGLSFTHCYAQPNCAPTRAALLSGQYPARINNDVYVVGHLNRNGRGGISKADARFLGPEQSNDVDVDAVTVAEALKKNGYATAHIGKYHVGGHEGERTMPENVGFDINIGGFSQGHQPTCFASKAKGKWGFKGVGLGHFDEYAAPYTEEYLRRRDLPAELAGTQKHISDAVGDALEETIKTLNAGGRPFYIQFHTYAVHGPVRSRPDLKKLAAGRKPCKGHDKAEYAGFISGVDENLGRMLAAIEDPDGDGDPSDSIAGNTLILFTSDNGGTHADNLPLRGKKGMFTEGGIRVPLIAYWKGVTPVNKVTDRMVHSVDFYTTYLDLAGRKWEPPDDRHPLDGESFAGVLREPDGQSVRGPVFYLFPGYMDVRAQPCVVAIDELRGKRYKLQYTYESESWELYCITDDIGEKSDLFKAQPEIAAGLSRKMNAWMRQKHSTWQPKYPVDKKSGKPAGPPPLL
jgi:arylsulfatase A-like enzyme